MSFIANDKVDGNVFFTARWGNDEMRSENLLRTFLSSRLALQTFDGSMSDSKEKLDAIKVMGHRHVVIMTAIVTFTLQIGV
jgi:hypothetical protein